MASSVGGKGHPHIFIPTLGPGRGTLGGKCYMSNLGSHLSFKTKKKAAKKKRVSLLNEKFSFSVYKKALNHVADQCTEQPSIVMFDHFNILSTLFKNLKKYFKKRDPKSIFQNHLEMCRVLKFLSNHSTKIAEDPLLQQFQKMVNKKFPK